MDLYERLLKERAEEEHRRGGSVPKMGVLGSKVLVRRLEVSQGCPRYAVDSSMMHRLITRGPRNAVEGMRLASLKAKYSKEYGELRAEERGQGALW